MPNRDIRTLGTVSAVAATDATILQPGTTGTAHKYALVSQILSGGLASSFANVAVTGTAVPTNGFYLPAANTPAIAVNGTIGAQWTAAAYSPGASDGAALGTDSLRWADLFLATGAVINIGNVTLTHSSGTLTLAGALSMGGALIETRSTAVAMAGTSQATATALTARVNIITSGTAGQGVVLGDQDQLVINRGTVAALVYPQVGAQIDAAGTNTAVTLAASTGSADFLRMSSTLYRTD